METIAQLCPDGGSPLAQAFIQSLRTISAERAVEVESLMAERDSYRGLALAAMAQLGELNTRLDRERSSRLFLLSQYRALRGDTVESDPAEDDAPMTAGQQAAA